MRKLDRLLRPRTIAVVGGGAWCVNIIEQCRKIGFTGTLYPVHPTRTEIAGETAYPGLAALPVVPDAAFVGVNAVATVEVVRTLAAMGAGGAVCFAAGFLEASSEISGAADLQADLLAAAGDMPILGPNCYGLINALDKVALWPDQHGCTPVERGVAIITQSSNIAINLTMQTRGLPIAFVVTVGNQAQVGLSEIGMALLEDPRVTALGLHIEGIGNLRAFEALAAKAYALGKRIVAVKVGASGQAQAATISHTASLAGSDAGAAALLRRLGIGRAKSLTVMLEALKILHVAGPLPSNRIASMSCSGGEASLIADTAVGLNVEFPALTPDQASALRDVLGPRVALANPLDYHTYIWANVDAMTRCFAAMMAADLALGCVILDYPRLDTCQAVEWAMVVEAVKAASRSSGRPMALVATLPECMPETVAAEAMATGIVPLCGLDDALAAIALCAGLVHREPADPVLLPDLAAPADGVQTLTEAEAKAELAECGVPVPRALRASSPDEAAAHAAAIGGLVVLKGEGVAHKTESGAVVLGLATPDAVRQAAQAMPATTFLVEEMVTGTLAELLIGVVADPAHGFVMTLGAGGTQSELLCDTQSLVLPVDAGQIGAALDGLRMGPVLAGYRGAPPANRQAIIDAVLALQAYVAANTASVREAEINPLICTPTHVRAVDALIRKGHPA